MLANDLYIWSLVFLGADNVSGWDNSHSTLMSMEKGRTPVYSCSWSLSGPDLGVANWQLMLHSHPLNQWHIKQNGYIIINIIPNCLRLFKNLYSLLIYIYFSEWICVYITCNLRKKYIYIFAALQFLFQIICFNHQLIQIIWWSFTLKQLFQNWVPLQFFCRLYIFLRKEKGKYIFSFDILCKMC